MTHFIANRLTCQLLIAALALGLARPATAEEPTWYQTELPGAAAQAEVSGLGTIRFPDGQTSLWVGTTAGTFRQLDGQWQDFPVMGSVGPAVRAILIAPGKAGQTTWWLATDEGVLLTADGQHWERFSTDNSPLLDNDILTVHLSQGKDGPEIWFGTRLGLTVWRSGNWENTLARPGGFHGGMTHTIRQLLVDGQRQTWAAGSAGISRHIDGEWQRWASDCLRGHTINAFETLDHSAGLRLVVATDRIVFVLLPNDPTSCMRLDLPDDPSHPIVHLARDQHDRLYLFSESRIDRTASPARNPDALVQWTFFDHRDGLGNHLQWSETSTTSADGRLWAGSHNGLWSMPPANNKTDSETAAPRLILSDQAGQRYRPGDRLQIDNRLEVALEATGMARPHALRFRARLNETEFSGPWRQQPELIIHSIGHGQHRLEIEIMDDLGRVHGPLAFTVQRAWPLMFLWGGPLALALMIGLTLALRRSRNPKIP